MCRVTIVKKILSYGVNNRLKMIFALVISHSGGGWNPGLFN